MNLFELFKETRRGKTIARTFFNLEIGRSVKDIDGVIIDLGSGGEPSYKRFLSVKSQKIVRVDINRNLNPDVIADLNQPLPFETNYADAIFLFNVIYIIEDPLKLLREIHRVLKSGGKLFFTSPFIFNEAPEPEDFWRFTSRGLEKLLKEAGFRDLFIKPMGERFSSAVYLISPFLFFWPVKLLFYLLAIIFDKFIPVKLKSKQPSPIGYFVQAKKSPTLKA